MAGHRWDLPRNSYEDHSDEEYSLAEEQHVIDWTREGIV